jgi:hypothetical protein
VFPGAVVDTSPGTQARSSLSFLFVAREGKGLGTGMSMGGLGTGGHGTSEMGTGELGMGGLCPNVTGTHKLNIRHLVVEPS